MYHLSRFCDFIFHIFGTIGVVVVTAGGVAGIIITEALQVSSQSGQYNKAGQKSSVAIKDSPVILDSVPRFSTYIVILI